MARGNPLQSTAALAALLSGLCLGLVTIKHGFLVRGMDEAQRTSLAWTGKYMASDPAEEDLGQNGEDRLDAAADDALQLCEEVRSEEGGVDCVHRVVPKR